jgi:type IV pilus assembly protein PilN
MRLNINLASRPYEDAGRFFLMWIPVTLALLLLAIFTTTLAWHRHQESRNVRGQLAEKQQQIAQLDKEYNNARTTLDLPENSGTRDQSEFLNELFRLKSFSWTKVLSDLEKVMPSGVQVVSIKPQINQKGQVEFTLVVATEKREDAIELARRMEGSPRFFQPSIRAEHAKKDTKDNRQMLTVDIVSQYVPDLKKGRS